MAIQSAFASQTTGSNCALGVQQGGGGQGGVAKAEQANKPRKAARTRRFIMITPFDSPRPRFETPPADRPIYASGIRNSRARDSRPARRPAYIRAVRRAAVRGD